MVTLVATPKGGIYLTAGQLSLTNSAVFFNRASGGGGE
jgi:hypothetical protein